MKTSKLILGGLLAVAGSMAQATVLTHQIHSTDNLYFVDWGHWYTQLNDGDALIPNNTNGAIGDGTPTTAVSQGGAAFAFDRSLYSSMTISVTGSVMDAGQTYTDPNGTSEPFRNNPSYSVIGLWSTSPILANDTTLKFDSFGNPYAAGDLGYHALSPTTSAPFFIGTGLTINFADIFPASVEKLYLFLANNDGDFADNKPWEFYTATITLTDIPQVPVPAAGLLLGSALIGLSAVARRRRIA